MYRQAGMTVSQQFTDDQDSDPTTSGRDALAVLGDSSQPWTNGDYRMQGRQIGGSQQPWQI